MSENKRTFLVKTSRREDNIYVGVTFLTICSIIEPNELIMILALLKILQQLTINYFQRRESDLRLFLRLLVIRGNQPSISQLWMSETKTLIVPGVSDWWPWGVFLIYSWEQRTAWRWFNMDLIRCLFSESRLLESHPSLSLSLCLKISQQEMLKFK